MTKQDPTDCGASDLKKLPMLGYYEERRSYPRISYITPRSQDEIVFGVSFERISSSDGKNPCGIYDCGITGKITRCEKLLNPGFLSVSSRGLAIPA